MKIALLILLLLLTPRVNAAEITAPEPTGEAALLMPRREVSFGEGFREIVGNVIGKLNPDIREGGKICSAIFAIVLLTSILESAPGAAGLPLKLASATGISLVFLGSARAMSTLARDTVLELSSYGKLLIPVLASAMAAQGRVSSSTALYGATALFNTLLSSLSEKILLPMVCVYLALAAANGALEDAMLKRLADFVRWLWIWVLKILLYVFTGYISLTGVVSGATDASALKAAKIAISSVVPVVGGILADASEAVLVSASVVRSSAGIYGILAVSAIVLLPFARLGIHCLMMKATAALCQILGGKQLSALVDNFSSALGLLLAMTGAMGLMLLISVVCFLRGVG